MADGWLRGLYLANPVRQIFMMGLVWRQAEGLGGRPIQILEIGSWHGASTLTWGEATEHHIPAGGSITCIDPWKPFFDEAANRRNLYHELNEYAEQAMEDFDANMKQMPGCVSLKVMRGFSQDILPTLGGPYDIIFIDGDHSYDAVRTDLKLAAPLLAAGGTLCGDDLEIQMRELDTALVVENRKTDVIALPGTDRKFHPGVTAAVGEMFGPVSEWAGLWAMRKIGDGWAPISLNGMPLTIPSFLSPKQRVVVHQHLLTHPL